MSDDRLRELGKQLSWDRPGAERCEAVRSSLLVAVTEDDRGASRKRWWLVGGGFAAGALAAAAIAIVVITPDRDAHPHQAHARIDAPPTAQLEHTVSATATGVDEVVRIRAGTVRLAVPAVGQGDRVRMRTADAEVEGTGTYEVVVTADTLARITVGEGTASVRVHGQPQRIFLAAGQTWRATIVTAELALPSPPETDEAALPPAAPPPPPPHPPRNPPASDPPSPPPAVVPRPLPTTPRVTTRSPERTRPEAASTAVDPTIAPPDEAQPRMPVVTTLPPAIESPASAGASGKPARQPSATERHFQQGWSLLRAGKAREAAAELGAAADASDGALAADARYFQAVALMRAGEGREAERVLVAFLDRAPTSLRRGRAAVLLGRLLRDRGDAASARAWFASAVDDADPAIAAAARAHLAALEPRR